MTFHLSDDDLRRCSEGEDIDLPKIPCHSQDNERAVADTTKAATSVTGYQRRHGFLLNLPIARENMPIRPKKT